MEETRKEAVAKLRDIGNVSGSCINGVFTYLHFIEKDTFIPAIIKRTEEYGEKIDPPSIDSLRRYSISSEVALLMAVYDELNWTIAEIKELGRNIPRVSLLVKFFLKYFTTLEASTDQAKMYWRRHYNFGELEVTSSELAEGNYIVEIEGFEMPPLYSEFLCGYLETMVGFVSANPISSEILKYSDENDPISRYRFFPKV
ncbi:MAG: hypothetical protein WDZ75_02190 [Candidatus Paceibacterota bacterium]